MVQGYIIDDKTDERIAGVLLQINDSTVAVTNSKGYFNIKIYPGIYKVTTKMLGYKPKTKELFISKENIKEKLFFRLKPEPVKIRQVVVSGKYSDSTLIKPTYSLFQGDLNKIPGVGEPDVFRALFSLPGVIQTSDINTQLYIQGGNFDELLITLDDVPVYNPYHVGGMFGIINPDIVYNENLFTSTFPSKYGDYLSGVLSINTQSGSSSEINGKVSIGLVSSKLFLKGPLLGGTFTLAARRTYLDLVSKVVLPKNHKFPYGFKDYFFKYNCPLNKNNLLSFTAFRSKDVFDIYELERPYFTKINIKELPNWGNNILKFNFRHLQKKIGFNFNIFYTNAFNNSNTSHFDQNNIFRKTFIKNNLENFSVSAEVNGNWSNNKFETGIKFTKLNMIYNWDIGKSMLTDGRWNYTDGLFEYSPNPYSHKDNTNLYVFYITDILEINNNLELAINFRNTFVEKYNKSFISPSLKLKYKFTNGLNLSLGIGKYYQLLYTIRDDNYSILLAPFTVYFLPETSGQIAGAENIQLSVKLPELSKGIQLQADIYYKMRNNLSSSYKYEPHYQLEQGEVIGGNAFLKFDVSGFYGWLSFSYNRSIKFNKSIPYYAPYDRTHSVKFLLNYEISKSWYISGFWIYATGLPYTPLIGKYLGMNDRELNDNFNSQTFLWYPIYGAKNSKRLPPYHRLDIGLNGSFLWGSFYVKPYFQIRNIYFSNNYFFIEDFPGDENFGKVIKSFGSVFLPTLGLTIEF